MGPFHTDSTNAATVSTVLRRRAGVVLVTVLLVGCGSNDSGSIQQALVSADDLPGNWSYFEPSTPSGTDSDLCGEPRERPIPIDSAANAWALTPDDGPIFGERIERYSDDDRVSALLEQPLETPCTFTQNDGTRWRTEELESLELGDRARVFLVTSLDRPDSFNYEVAVVSGDVVVLAVLNTRRPNRELLDELVRIAWSKAVREGVVDDHGSDPTGLGARAQDSET